MPAASGQSKFLEARTVQLIVDLYLAGHLDTPSTLLNQPLSRLRLRILTRRLNAKATGELLTAQAMTRSVLISGLMPFAAPNTRERVLRDRLDAARKAWFVAQGSSAVLQTSQQDIGDLASMWQKLVDAGLASGQV